jgi:hypothetical protein
VEVHGRKFEDLQERVRLINYFTNHADAQAWKTVPVGDGLFRLEAVNGAGVMTDIDSDGHSDIRIAVTRWKNQDDRNWELVPLPDHFTA